MNIIQKPNLPYTFELLTASTARISEEENRVEVNKNFLDIRKFKALINEFMYDCAKVLVAYTKNHHTFVDWIMKTLSKIGSNSLIITNYMNVFQPRTSLLLNTVSVPISVSVHHVVVLLQCSSSHHIYILLINEAEDENKKVNRPHFEKAI